ncbi:MAG: bifunctional proline dehydrogenase/L-glutamate gamma-semialdehyde dehydrogenase [Actinomycetota bacterium]|nr:bifunctional proline dehydrogenase/L-glutamate gamma-semialdehyde dehydrogenase [Actinomycetota bacterium]
MSDTHPVIAPDIVAVTARAERLLVDSLADLSRRERRQQQRLAGVVQDERLRALTFALTDEVLRFGDVRRAAARFRSIVADVGVPSSLGLVDRWSLRLGAALAPLLPWVVMPLVRARIVRESNGVVLAADDPAFERHLATRADDGFRMNVNVLGEAILSDDEAAERLWMIRERIARPDVTYVSLKISAVVANLDVLAFDQSIERICECLRVLYRDAETAVPTTFVNLDMEEYRDLPLTIAALVRVLDEPEFASVHAGVVLQAYLPDSHDACDRLGEWAQARHERAGGTLKIRIVKGANLAMEQVEAEQHGWEQAPYLTKAEVDASFKRLVLRALDPRWASSVRVGFASHNLFDLAWALSLPKAERARVDIEMLEGMAPAQARTVRAAAGDVLLYAPVVRHDDLSASIAYLTRRLDENTSPDNFLRSLFTLRPGSAEWRDQRSRFEAAVTSIDAVSVASRRRQDRTLPPAPVDRDGFENCADTDWTRAANRAWIADALAACEPTVPPLVDTIDETDAVVARACGAATSWAAAPFAERRALLSAVADEMERRRGHTVALMARTACKTVAEGDPEVSEAIDFARYYGWCTHAVEQRIDEGLTFTAAGVVLVASPWNFPYAIPAGGVLAALAAGNAVVLKPAPEVREVGYELAEQLWRAGVPRDLVQFVACPDDEVGRRLVTHPQVATVVLTGAYETAQLFRSWKPSIRVLAETSGKNALVVTAAADEDAAIRDLVRSAFGHAGQKCSAASLAIVEAAVYDDHAFMRRLAAAVRSVRVGPSDDLATMTGPIVGHPSPKLRRALTTLESGESWLVEPQCIDDERHVWSPGVRIGVQPGSWFHLTECFGPVLGIMRADHLDHAIELQNAGQFGLTGGIHSLDEHEIAHWLDRVEVGNAYVNRHITGAVVQRQPFGGWKRSSVGCGPKAGGPFYVEAFGTWSAGPGTVDMDALAADFGTVWREHFCAEHDPSGLACERNVLRYRPLPSVNLYVAPDADPADVEIARMAARVAGVPAPMVASPATGTADRVRVIGSITEAELVACHAAGVEVDLVQPVAEPMVELRRWVREQSISTTRHRHGRLLD